MESMSEERGTERRARKDWRVLLPVAAFASRISAPPKRLCTRRETEALPSLLEPISVLVANLRRPRSFVLKMRSTSVGAARGSLEKEIVG